MPAALSSGERRRNPNRMKFWRALERLPDGAVMLQWQRELGDQIEVARPLLRLSQDLANTYPCTNPAGCGIPHRVEEHGRGGRVAVCDLEEWCEPIVVESRDLLIFNVDIGKLCAGIGHALGFTLPIGRN